MKFYNIMIVFGLLTILAVISFAEDTEIIERRTLNSKTFKTGFEQYRTDVYSVPIHYQANNKLEEINKDLAPSDGEYDYEIRKGNYQVFFKSNMSGDFPCLYVKNNLQLGFGLVALVYCDKTNKNFEVIEEIKSFPNAQVVNNQIVYSNILSGITLKLRYLPTILKEEIILSQGARENLPHPSSFGIDEKHANLMFLHKIDLSNVTASANYEDIGKGSGNSEINTCGKFKIKHDKDFLCTLAADVAYVWGHESEIDSYLPMESRIFKDKDSYYLMAGMAYVDLINLPSGDVIFDPTFDSDDPTNPVSAKDTYICSASSTVNMNYGSGNPLFISRRSSYKHRALISFDLTAIPSGSDVTSATLELQCAGVELGGDFVRLYRLNNSWEEGNCNASGCLVDAGHPGASWNLRTYNQSWINPGGDYENTILSEVEIRSAGKFYFNLPGSTVAGWINNPGSNNGVLIVTKNDITGSTSQCVVKFNPSESGYNPPVIHVTYTSGGNEPPASPGNLGCTNYDNAVYLDWLDNTEPDLVGYNVFRANSSNGYNYNTPLNNTILISSSYNDNTAVNGNTYYYVVRAVDDMGNVSGNSNEAIGSPSSSGGTIPADSFWKKILDTENIQYNDGKVSINTERIDKELNVNGTILAKELILESDNWSDFVFENDYPLRSLKELRQFILKNGKLPEMPSAAEITKDGICMSQMQIRLLQKIEELTLYLIQQDQRIEQLLQENRQLLPVK